MCMSKEEQNVRCTHQASTPTQHTYRDVIGCRAYVPSTESRCPWPATVCTSLFGAACTTLALQSSPHRTRISCSHIK